MILPFTKSPEEKSFNVLVADGQTTRANSFRLLARGKPFNLQFAYTWHRFSDLLAAPPVGGWDLLYTSGYLGEWGKHFDMVLPIATAFKQKRLRGVILNSPVDEIGSVMLHSLKAHHVPVAWYPYDSLNPRNRVRKEAPKS